MILKDIEIYRDSHLPTNGWIQSCFNCYSLTSKTILYKTIMQKNTIYDFRVYLCPSCNNKFKKKILGFIEFSNVCNKYIKKNYLHGPG